MHLLAYPDRFGDQRFGVLVDGGLLTGAQLEKRGGLGALAEVGSARPRDLETTGGDVDAPRPARARARRPLIDPRTRPPPPAARRRAPGKIVCVGLNYGDHVAEGGRARARPAAAVRQVRRTPSSATATPIVRPRGHPRASTSRSSWASSSAGRARRVPVEDAHGPCRGLCRRQRHQRPRLAGQPAGPARGREGRRPVAPRQGQRHVPADRPGLRDARRARPARPACALRSWRIPGSGGRRASRA